LIREVVLCDAHDPIDGRAEMSSEGVRVARSPERAGTFALRIGVPAGLLLIAGAGWWWSADVADEMSGAGMGDMADPMSLGAFVVAWVAMMAAMMLPAVLPAVRMYAHAVVGKTAPVVIFIAGYLAVWSAVGIPAYLAWSRLDQPVAHASPWAARLAGAVAVAAGLHQLTPLKGKALGHCRSPMSFLPHGEHLYRPAPAFVAGGRHGIFCLASCSMLMAVLIAFGTMQLAWMLGLAVLIWLEKITPFGDRLTRVTAALLVLLGVALLAHPAFMIQLV
jgi:predicted metal-binding membrane protein